MGENTPPLILEGQGAVTRTSDRMTTTGSAIKDISAAIRKRGNQGANRGRTYVRQSSGYDRSSIFGEVVLAILIASDVPEYRHLKSNHVYSLWQKIAILVFMAYQDIPMNSLQSELGKYQGFVKSIGIGTIPHGSTMCKFLKSIDKSLIERAFLPFQRLIAKGSTTAMDATGLSNFIRSAHYEFRCDDFGKKLPHRTFTKLSIVIDTSTRFVLSARAAIGNRNDIKFAEDHVSDLVHCKDKVGVFLADKGYDSSELHMDLALRIGCEVRIPVRESKKNGYTVHGLSRRRMLTFMKSKAEWKKAYGKRSVIESTNFMVKNLTGANIRCLLGESRNKTALLKALAFNIENSMRLGMDWMLTV